VLVGGHCDRVVGNSIAQAFGTSCEVGSFAVMCERRDAGGIHGRHSTSSPAQKGTSIWIWDGLVSVLFLFGLDARVMQQF